MAATGKTPILLYGSTTATNQPSAGNLTNSSDGCEIAINVADKNLFFKDSTNTVNKVPIRQSNASSDGWLSSTDWSTFNSKQPAGSYVTSVTGTAPVVSSGGTTPAISMAAATGSVNGYLTSTDWNTFNNKAPAFTYTTNYVPYGQGTTTPAQSSSFTFNGTTLNAPSVTTTGDSLLAISGGVVTVGTTNTSLGGLFAIRNDSGICASFNSLYTNGAAINFQNIGADSFAIGMPANTGDLAFYQSGIGGTETARFTNGNLKFATSGKGIDFSATAGTGTSELLADYEEGTWTPSSTFITVVGTFSSSGTYTKIGRQVTVVGTMSATTSITVGATGIVTDGLPYSANKSVGALVNNSSNANAIVYATGPYVVSTDTVAATPSWTFTITYFV